MVGTVYSQIGTVYSAQNMQTGQIHKGSSDRADVTLTELKESLTKHGVVPASSELGDWSFTVIKNCMISDFI